MIIPTGYGQLNFIFTGNAVLRGAQVTLGFGQGDALDASTFAATAGAAWAANLLPLQDESILLDSVKCKLGPNATGPEATISIGGNGGGTSGGLPPNVTGLVTKITALGGRKGKGRMNIPAIPEDDTLGGGFIEASRLLVWQGALDDFYADLLTYEIVPNVLHTDATTPTPITGFLMQQKFATQKRRLRKTSGHRPTP